jgi:hypothetical protein
MSAPLFARNFYALHLLSNNTLNGLRQSAVLKYQRMLGLFRTLQFEKLAPAHFGTPLAFARRMLCSAAHG